MTVVSEEFYIIQPAEAVNEVTNPSSETNQNGKTASGAGVSIARSSAYQRRGLWSDEVTTVSGLESGIYFGTVNEVSGVARTFSADVLGVTAGQPMRIQIRTTAGAVLSETTFTSNGYWQRVKVTRTGTANTTRRLYVVRDAIASTAKFYVDGWYYSTVDGTYLDGDMKGFSTRIIDYRWNGAPHASTSWRSGQTRSGGTLVRIKDFARILFTLGLGMAAITNVAVPTSTGNSSYQTTRTNDREIIFSLVFDGTLDAMQADRQALINAVNPEAVSVKQPTIIRYQGLDANGGDATEPVDIYAHYVDGLQNGPTIPGIERANLRFTSYLPFIQKSGDSGVTLGYNTLVTNFSNIGYRDVDGTWKAMGTGNTGATKTVMSITPGPDGAMYVGGYGVFGGVGGTDGFAKWDGAAWSALGTIGLPGAVKAIAFAPDGTWYAGGSFPSMNGVANTNKIARWNGAAWVAVGTGVTAGGDVESLVIGTDGALYAGGGFTQMGGVVNTNGIAKWTGSAWVAVGTGMDGAHSVMALAVGPNGHIYAGGDFDTMSGVAGTAGIAEWDGSAWTPLASGVTAGGVGTGVRAMAFAPDGRLYAGGKFASMVGANKTQNIASWNGTQWGSIAGGIDNGQVEAIAVSNKNAVYVSGTFTTAGGITLPDRITYEAAGTWQPVDVNVQDSVAYIYALAFDQADRLYIGGTWSGTTALSATVTVPATGNVGLGNLVITLTGPGAVWQLKNYSTGQVVYFKGLTLLAGEVATLDLRPGKRRFSSTFRKDLMSYILNGSTLDFHLQRGDNNISAYMTGTTGASGIVMTWQEMYQSIDGAKR